MFCRIKSALGELEKLCGRAGDVLKNTAAQEIADCVEKVKELRGVLLETRTYTFKQIAEIDDRLKALEKRHRKIDADRRVAKKQAKKKTKK